MHSTMNRTSHEMNNWQHKSKVALNSTALTMATFLHTKMDMFILNKDFHTGVSVCVCIYFLHTHFS